MPKQRFLALFALLLTSLCILSVRPTPVYAHAIVVRTEPADGAVLGGPPQQVRLWFSEPVALGFTSFELIDSAGKHIAVVAHSDAASAALAVRNEGISTVEVILDLPALSPSVYRLSWTALSNTDLHNTVGSIVFGVQRATDGTTAAAAEPVPSPIELALRWLNFGALASLIGALALLALPRPTLGHGSGQATDDRETRRQGDKATRRQGDWAIISSQVCVRLLRMARWSAGLALLAGLGLLLEQAAVAGYPTGQNVLASAWFLAVGTSYGGYWLLRQALLVALLITLILGRKDLARAPTSHFYIPNFTFSILLVVAQALQGHATAFAELSPLRIFADALHLLAAGIWVGGLLALTVAVVPLLRVGPEPLALAWAILRRFGALAAASLAALLITGLFMSGQQVASLDALLTTLYGRALLLKVGLAAAVALIGLRNATTLHPRIAAALRRPAAALAPALPRHLSPVASGEGKIRLPSPVAMGAGLGVRASSAARLARTIALEASGAALLLLLAAFLGAAQPARGPEFDPPVAEPVVAVATTHADDLVVTLALKPNRPGQNFVTLGVFDTRRPAPAPISEVAVQLQRLGAPAAARLVASPLGKGRYELTDDSISSAGDMNIVVTIHRPGLPDATAMLPWTVLPTARQPRAVLVSNQPLAPWMNGAAPVIALLLIFTLIGLRLRRRMLSHAPSFTSTISGVVGRRLRPLRKD